MTEPTSARPVAVLRDVTQTVSGRVVLSGMSLTVGSRDRVAVLGANRSGKSTLLRLLAGVDPPGNGQVTVSPAASVGWLPQEPRLDADGDVRGAVERAVAPVRVALARYQRVSEQLAVTDDEHAPPLLDDLSTLQATIDRLSGWDVDARVAQAIDALRCPPPATPLSDLSGGERRRVALCALLMTRPDLLVLDEPTNHLDAEAIEWLEEHLTVYPGTVVAASHDREFLDAFAERIVELDGGRASLYVGGYRPYLTQKASRLDAGRRKDAARAALLRWELGAVADSTGDRERPGALTLPDSPRLGEHVIEARHVSKSVGERRLLTDVTFSLSRDAVVGVIGPNGAGKSTLLNVLAGTVAPDAGTIEVGGTVVTSHVSQDRDMADPTLRVWQAAAGVADIVIVAGREVSARAFLAAFGFKGSDQDRTVASLSGGERNRLHLVLALLRPGNVLLLDEPTNDLDVQTVAELEAAISRFSGCVVVATHDRWFLRRVATHILASTGDGHWCWFPGGYDAWRRSRSGDGTAGQPRGARRQLVR